MDTVRNRGWLVIACSLLGACGMEIGGDSADGAPYDDDVAVQRAELGAISTLFTINGAQTLLGMNSAITLLTRDAGASCNPNGTLWRLQHSNQSSLSTSACTPKYRHGALASDNTTFVWDDADNSIRRWNTSPAQLVTIKTNVSSLFGTLVADTGFVYFADLLGIQRVPRNGGATVNIVPGNWYLLAIDGSKIVFYRRLGHRNFELHSANTDGSQHVQHITLLDSDAFTDFAVGPSHYFWADNGTAIHHISRLSKAGGSTTTIVSAPINSGDTFRHPTPTPDGTKVYYVTRSVAGIGSIIINKLVGSTTTAQLTGYLEILDMAATNSKLTWVEDAVSSKRVKSASL